MKDCKDKRLIVFGDSIMYGSGNHGYGVGEYLHEKLGFSVQKYCVGGARVGYRSGKSWVVEQIRKAVEDGAQADLIIFDGFTNDCNISEGATLPDVPLGEIPETTSDIFDVAQDDSFSICFDAVAAAIKNYFRNAKALFVRPHKMGRRKDDLQRIYGERAVEICKKWDIAVADIYTESDMNTFNEEDRDKYTFDSYGWGRGDATHPNALGYKEKYLPYIISAIEKL